MMKKTLKTNCGELEILNFRQIIVRNYFVIQRLCGFINTGNIFLIIFLILVD